MDFLCLWIIFDFLPFSESTCNVYWFRRRSPEAALTLSSLRSGMPTSSQVWIRLRRTEALFQLAAAPPPSATPEALIVSQLWTAP